MKATVLALALLVSSSAMGMEKLTKMGKLAKEDGYALLGEVKDLKSLPGQFLGGYKQVKDVAGAGLGYTKAKYEEAKKVDINGLIAQAKKYGWNTAKIGAFVALNALFAEKALQYYNA